MLQINVLLVNGLYSTESTTAEWIIVISFSYHYKWVAMQTNYQYSIYCLTVREYFRPKYGLKKSFKII
jgi:hypothetical protein